MNWSCVKIFFFVFCGRAARPFFVRQSHCTKAVAATKNCVHKSTLTQLHQKKRRINRKKLTSFFPIIKHQKCLCLICVLIAVVLYLNIADKVTANPLTSWSWYHLNFRWIFREISEKILGVFVNHFALELPWTARPEGLFIAITFFISLYFQHFSLFFLIIFQGTHSKKLIREIIKTK